MNQKRHKAYLEHKTMLQDGLIACYWAIDKIKKRLEKLDKEHKRSPAVGGGG